MMHSNFWDRKMEDISDSSDRQGREREREIWPERQEEMHV